MMSPSLSPGVRGEECDIVGDRLLDALSLDRKVRKVATLQFRALPGDRGKVRHRRKQQLGTTQSDEALILGQLTEMTPHRTFVEFGFHPLEFNCIRLAADLSWCGLVVDADGTMIAKVKENTNLGNTQATHSFLTLENLDIIRRQFDHLGVLSIDVDGNDYWFLKAQIDLCP